ncbi:MAG: Cof-type HAD-IIB family hydrolase, partial [Defluviitaleaceae bacterium]|nr:Cof-type HAD-IIB family hydrolase [Defluviitaleaceae bacterium]
MYKLIVTDMDSTLIDSSFAICEKNKAAIHAAMDMGIRIVFCSGRPCAGLLHFAREFDIIRPGNYIIGFNGCVVYDLAADKTLFEDELGIDAAIIALENFADLQARFGLENSEAVVYKNNQEIIIGHNGLWSTRYKETSKTKPIYSENLIDDLRKAGHCSKVIFIGLNEELQIVSDVLAEKLDGVAEVMFSAEYFLEIASKNSSKGTGLQWLCDHIGIDIKETIAIGDNFNDISMIEAAGFGVAVANAVNKLKDIADYTTVASCG